MAFIFSGLCFSRIEHSVLFRAAVYSGRGYRRSHANSPIKRNPSKSRAGIEAGTMLSCSLQEIRATGIAYNKPGKSRAEGDA
ncbi:hypothetical protein [Pseudomonas atacamensis]|uniref:hypothetical protein n=1 Tax=Pseudomonas atacamensis TaxID=2565368 RepID=UPI0037F3AA7B